MQHETTKYMTAQECVEAGYDRLHQYPPRRVHAKFYFIVALVSKARVMTSAEAQKLNVDKLAAKCDELITAKS